MSKLQLIIPMSGLGSRFVEAGYSTIKPLIEVHGKPMVEWVLKLFPSEREPLFICRREHIESTPLREVLMGLRPNASIAVIEGSKQGPVAALLAAQDYIDDESPALVSYCDYYMHWDYAAFKAFTLAAGYDGAIPCYTGFHPHLLPAGNLYASCLTDNNNMLREILEKHSFTADKTNSLHSPGAYFFRSGAMLKHYSHALVDKGETVNGEYYVSMLYNLMLADGLRMHVPANVTRFCQWGTPQDLAEYVYWVETVKRFTS